VSHTPATPHPDELLAALEVIRAHRAKKPARRKHAAKLKTNTLYCGDNLEILKSLPDESVDLIYLDPPFAAGDTFDEMDPKRLTPQLIHAIGWDAGNRSMTQAGRKAWSVKDWNAAAAEALRLSRIPVR
jgi:DNA modification methylase